MSRDERETLDLSPAAVFLAYVGLLLLWFIVYGLLNLF